ncbi:MAG TPA: hypothetical protein VHP33_06750 [Polyangiaceae bacterium]|nr:hypothetical protein [Polyangiaceae bacterium]
MSIDNEELLEEALRGDLPTPDVEARVRRRLLAAGVAVGQGVATTTAVASGAGAAGAAVKAASLSWGLKLGLAAFVAIPTVGILLEGRHDDAKDAAVKVAAPQAAQQRPAPPVAQEPAPPSPALAEGQASTPPAEQRQLRPKAATPAVVTTPAEAQPSPAHPSQADFAATAPDAPTRAPLVGSTLAEETRLLDGAFAALATGKLERARALVSEHETRFPTGLLLKERERAKARISELSRGE